MWCLRMWILILIDVPCPTLRCYLIWGHRTMIIKHHILKHHIPELPIIASMNAINGYDYQCLLLSILLIISIAVENSGGTTCLSLLVRRTLYSKVVDTLANYVDP